MEAFYHIRGASSEVVGVVAFKAASDTLGIAPILYELPKRHILLRGDSRDSAWHKCLRDCETVRKKKEHLYPSIHE